MTWLYRVSVCTVILRDAAYLFLPQIMNLFPASEDLKKYKVRLRA